MIHVERGEAPPEMNGPAITAAKKKIVALRKSSAGKPEQQTRVDFETRPLRSPAILTAIFKIFRSKCAYCEEQVSRGSAAVDAFRPRSFAIDLQGKRSPNHYWWLAYEWSNLYLSCFYCLKFKGPRFPVKGERAPEGATGPALDAERPLLLDPCSDYPEEHFLFNNLGHVASQTEQGIATIDILGLNRNDLLLERKYVLTVMQVQWKQFLKELESRAKASKSPKSTNKVKALKDAMYSPDLSYLAMRRQFLQQWSLEAIEKQPGLEPDLKDFLSFRTAVKKQLSPDASPSGASISDVVSSASKKDPASKAVESEISKNVRDFRAAQVSQETFSLEDAHRKQDYYRKARFIERIEIRNFKVIEYLDLRVNLQSSQHGSWLLLLGENGRGKSSILQALALALCGDAARKLVGIKDASQFVRYGHSDGFVRVYLTGTPEPIELTFSSKSKVFKSNAPAPKLLLLAYGATRLVPRKEARLIKGSPFTRPFNLFNPFVALKDPNRWLLGLWKKDDRAQFNEAATVIKQLFLLDKRDKLSIQDGKVLITGPTFRVPTPLSDLSAGYESVLALLTDVVGTLSRRWPDMDAAEGLVLVDEIDAHLHPRWKMAIIPKLRGCFPQVQFIVTSHEPLTLRTLKATEIAILERDEKGKVFAITEDLPEPRALRIEQLLTSEFFGLSSTVDPDLEEKYDEYYKLLGKRRRSKPENARVEELKNQLDKLQQFGSTERERVMLEATDKFLAARKAKPRRRKEFKKQTQKVIEDLWKDF